MIYDFLNGQCFGFFFDLIVLIWFLVIGYFGNFGFGTHTVHLNSKMTSRGAHTSQQTKDTIKETKKKNRNINF